MQLPKDLPLWKAFQEKNKSPENAGNIEKLIEKSAALLDRVIETFPKYTLHDSSHAHNVARIMGELLGREGLAKLTGFECAILLLAAYFHDIGMVFSEDEKNDLRQEDDFEDFKKKYPDILPELVENPGLSSEIAERYCRFIHQKRVFYYLKKESFKDLLKWNDSSFAKELGLVCESHGRDIRFITDSEEIKPDYDLQHDLRFCALLLRLADILDFDDSRSPDVVYEYLALDKPGSENERISRAEWRKHLVSKGFIIRDNKVAFNAEPDHPALEYDMRKFLDLIEDELRNGSVVLNYCSDRWKSFPLPDKIHQKNIKSRGYVYGEHRFTLEQQNILDLLMGENLYNDKYVFVRELLQNALDTTRHRIFIRRAEAGTGEDVPVDDLAIQVSSWTDEEGYEWVRFDDNGMGMDRDIIENYFLKIGKSYYDSPVFQADILDYKKKSGKDFLPISRFGIGILSCFLVGDRVEVSTKKDSSLPVRLSLLGLHNFFIMQIKDEHSLSDPRPVPSKKGGDYGFRKKTGTTVAVRLDPAKEAGKWDLEESLKSYLLFPDVEVRLNGRCVSEGKQKLYKSSWIKNETIQTVELPDVTIKEMEKFLVYKFKEKPKIIIIPVNLKKHSPTEELEGLIILYYLWFSENDIRDMNRFKGVMRRATILKESFIKVEIAVDNVYLTKLKLKKKYLENRLVKITNLKEPGGQGRITNLKKELKNLSQYMAEFATAFQELNIRKEAWKYKRKGLKDEKWINFIFPKYHASDEIFDRHGRVERLFLGHNGIKVLPLNRRLFSEEVPYFIGEGNENPYFHEVLILTYDSLRPDISVSREEFFGLNWNTYSAYYYSLWQGLKKLNRKEVFKQFYRHPGIYGVLFGTIRNDPLLISETRWRNEKIINVLGTYLSVEQIQDALKSEAKLSLEDWKSPDSLDFEMSSSDFMKLLIRTLIQVNLDVFFDGEKELLHVKPGEPQMADYRFDLFPPMFFVPYVNSGKLRINNCPLNLNSKFSRWLVNNAETMSKKYPGIFNTIINDIKGYSPYYFWSGRDKDYLTRINNLIKRIFQLDKSFDNGQDIFLKKEDFEVRDAIEDGEEF